VLESWKPVPVIVTDVPTGPTGGRKATTRGAAACAAGMLATSTTVTADAIARASVVPRRMERFIAITFSVPSAVASRRHPYGRVYRFESEALIGEKTPNS
jgi:hypothetical protein